MTERASRSADKNIHTMADPRERMGVFGAHAARSAYDGLTHGDGMGGSTTPSGAAPRQYVYSERVVVCRQCSEL